MRTCTIFGWDVTNSVLSYPPHSHSSITLVDTLLVLLENANLRAESSNSPNVEFLQSIVKDRAEHVSFEISLGFHPCVAASESILAHARGNVLSFYSTLPVSAPCAIHLLHLIQQRCLME